MSKETESVGVLVENLQTAAESALSPQEAATLLSGAAIVSTCMALLERLESIEKLLEDKL